MARHYPEKPKTTLPEFIPSEYPSDLPEGYEDLWFQVWSFGAGVYQERDYFTIKKYVQNQARYDQAQRQIDEDGITQVGSQDQVVPSAAFRVAKELATQLQAAEDRLGLSPRSAAEIGLNKVKGAKGKAELEKFLSEGS